MEPYFIIAGIETLLVGALIGGLAAGVAAYFFAPKPNSQRRNKGRGRSANVRSAEVARHVVYGYTVKGGLLFYINGTGSENKYLHEMLAMAGHGCEAIGDVRYGGETADKKTVNPSHDPFTNGCIAALRAATPRDLTTKYQNLHRVRRHTGQPGQQADSLALAENPNLTANHRAQGTAYVYCRFENDPEVFTSFIPNITAEVFGKNNVFDPRADTRRWTMNPALVIADILETYLGVDRENIDRASLVKAADICDERVPRKDGSLEPRYTANGYFELDGNWETWLTPFINAMAGAVVEWGGTYYILAGAWVEPVLEITDADFMGTVKRKTADSDQKRANAAKGTYVSPASFDQPTEFPPVKDAVAIGEDGGRTNWLELDLEMVNTHTQAQRVASILLNESRLDETVIVEVTLAKGLDVKPWDNVRLRSAIFGIDETYRVIEHRVIPRGGSNPSMAIELTLKRHNAGVYAWDPATSEKDIQNAKTNLPGVNDAKNPGAATYSMVPRAQAENCTAATVTINWTDPLEAFEAIEAEFELEVETREPGGQWQALTITESLEVPPGAQTATFDARDETQPDGTREFRNHEVKTVKIRSRLATGVWGDYIVPDPA